METFPGGRGKRDKGIAEAWREVAAALFITPPPQTQPAGRSLTRRLSLGDSSLHQSAAVGVTQGRERWRDASDGGKERSEEGEINLIKRWRGSNHTFQEVLAFPPTSYRKSRLVNLK